MAPHWTQDVVQINIYGATLNGMLNEGVNIPHILRALGYGDCIVFDVPRRNDRLNNISSASPDESLFSQTGHGLFSAPREVKIETSLTTVERPRLSMPHREVTDNALLYCSLSTIASCHSSVLGDEEEHAEQAEMLLEEAEFVQEQMEPVREGCFQKTAVPETTKRFVKLTDSRLYTEDISVSSSVADCVVALLDDVCFETDYTLVRQKSLVNGDGDEDSIEEEENKEKEDVMDEERDEKGGKSVSEEQDILNSVGNTGKHQPSDVAPDEIAPQLEYGNHQESNGPIDMEILSENLQSVENRELFLEGFAHFDRFEDPAESIADFYPQENEQQDYEYFVDPLNVAVYEEVYDEPFHFEETGQIALKEGQEVLMEHNLETSKEDSKEDMMTYVDSVPSVESSGVVEDRSIIHCKGHSQDENMIMRDDAETVTGLIEDLDSAVLLQEQEEAERTVKLPSESGNLAEIVDQEYLLSCCDDEEFFDCSDGEVDVRGGSSGVDAGGDKADKSFLEADPGDNDVTVPIPNKKPRLHKADSVVSGRDEAFDSTPNPGNVDTLSPVPKKKARHSLKDIEGKTFTCRFKNCHQPITWKKSYGRHRFLDHVKVHSIRPAVKCAYCDLRAGYEAKLRYHYKTCHPTMPWAKPTDISTAADKAALADLWGVCFPEIPLPRIYSTTLGMA